MSPQPATSRWIVDLGGDSSAQFEKTWSVIKAADPLAKRQDFATLRLVIVTHASPSVPSVIANAGYRGGGLGPIYIPANDLDLPSISPWGGFPKPGLPPSFKGPTIPLPGLPDAVPLVHGLSVPSHFELSLSDPVEPRLDWQIGVCKLARAVTRFTGKDVRVGFADSGVDNSRAALRDRVTAFRVVEKNAHAGELQGISIPHDRNGHGSSAASIILALHPTGGTWGLAPAASVFAAAITMGDTTAWDDAQLVAALEWFAEEKVRIACLALGRAGAIGDGHDTVLAAARRCNILPIVAVGNSACGDPASPATSRFALSVGALSGPATIASNSACGKALGMDKPYVPKVLAPGTLLVSKPETPRPFLDGPYTSYAAPFVASVAALLLEACPSATCDQLEAALLTTTSRLKRAGCGCPEVGILNFDAALARLKSFGLACAVL